MFSAPYIQKFRKGIDGSERVVCTYKLGRMLGKGAFAQVYEVEDTEKEQRFACKIVSKASLAKRSAQIKLMSEVRAIPR
jgi:serine/threonine protein kinase